MRNIVYDCLVRELHGKQSWIVSRHCLGLETSRDRFFDVSVSVSVSDPTVSVSVSVSRSFLDFWKLSRSKSLVFLEIVSKRKSCSLVVLVQTVFCSELRTVLRYKKSGVLVLRIKSIEKSSYKFALSVQNCQIS